MSQNVQISAIGLCTSLGGYSDACAAFRAGLNRFQADAEIVHSAPGDEEPTPLTIAPIPDHLSGFQGKGRLIKMLQIAFRDLTKHLGEQPSLDDTLLILATPDPVDRYIEEEDEDETENQRDRRLQAYLDDIINPLSLSLDVPLNNLPTLSLFGERISFARALDKAVGAISNSQYSKCLIAVVDSLLDYDTLDVLMATNQLKTSENPTGFIAAEGAAFMLITSEQSGSKNALNCRVSNEIDRAILDLNNQEAITEAWHGNKLYELIIASLGPEYKKKVLPQIISDINAHENRAIELSLVQMKLQQQYPNSVIPEAIVPALTFGETGCLAGAYGIAIAFASIQRKYAQHKQFCVLLSDNTGQRAVLFLNF